MTPERNYGDQRIVEFDALVKACEQEGLPNNAEFWRRKATAFRQQHAQDEFWRNQPEIEVAP